jgi:hypothetical protein
MKPIIIWKDENMRIVSRGTCKPNGDRQFFYERKVFDLMEQSSWRLGPTIDRGHCEWVYVILCEKEDMARAQAEG